MLLLTATLLTAQTNESYKTTDGPTDRRHTADKRNILTSHRLMLSANREESTDADVVDPLIIEKNESASRLAIKQRSKVEINIFNLNESASSNKERTENFEDGRVAYTETNKDVDIETQNINTEDTQNIEKGVRAFEKRNESGKISSKDDKTTLKPLKSERNLRNIAENRNSSHISTILGNDEDKRNGTTQKGKTFGIDHNLGNFEEIHIYEEEKDDEIIVEIIDEDGAHGKSSETHMFLEEKTVDNAVQFGIKTMEDLMNVKEPMWYQMGKVIL